MGSLPIPRENCVNSKARTVSLSKPSKYSRRQQVSSRGRATRDTVDLCVHRRASRSVRGRSDLPRALRARMSDRPEDVLRLAVPATVEPGVVGRGDRGDTGQLLRTRRAGRRKPESLYGATKMWAHLQRQGIEVARCTVERLMAANGWEGVRRRKKVRTTIVDPAAGRAPDLVDRQFAVPAPNRLLVADMKCRRRHFMSYADPRNMPITSVMVYFDSAFGVVRSA